ncbi:MAG: hypothetical protein ACJ8D9_13355 [Xanthobacteraceae bacterium]
MIRGRRLGPSHGEIPMSEYQYYEFQAIDRLLDADARAQLRAISTRARITPATFVNTYNWGDLKADPLKLLERYFDLLLYFSNWGTRQFAMRLPARLVDVKALKACALPEDIVLVRPSGEHVIVSMQRSELDCDEWGDEGEDDSGWLGALAPLRSELLAGDLRVFSLLWLFLVQEQWVDDDAIEPAPRLGPLSPALAALADFLCIDGDLVEAATASRPPPQDAEPPPTDVERCLRGLADDDKVRFLMGLYRRDDPHLAAELRRRVRAGVKTPVRSQPPARTAGELRGAARRMEAERVRLAEEKSAAERRRQEQAAAAAREKRLKELARRGDAAWEEAENLIALRNASGYHQATMLLVDLGELADRHDAFEGFAQRMADLRARHASKRSFIGRLDAAGLPMPSPGMTATR